MTEIPRVIVKLLTRPGNQYLRGTIFHKIYTDNSSIHKAVDLYPHKFDAHTILDPHSAARKPVEIILAVRGAWQRLLHKVMHPQEREMAPGEASMKTLASMFSCLPAGVIWDPKPEQRTCKKAMVCPWCRFRLGLKIRGRVEAYVPRYRWIAKTTLLLPLGDYSEAYMVHASELGLTKLLKKILNKRCCWDAGVTVILPEYDRKMSGWNVRVMIIALLNDRNRLKPLESLVQLEQWDNIPPVQGNSWQVRRSTVTAARQFVADAVAYSPQHLRLFRRVMEGENQVKDPTMAVDILALAGLSKLFRTRYHRMPPVRSVSSD